MIATAITTLALVAAWAMPAGAARDTIAPIKAIVQPRQLSGYSNDFFYASCTENGRSVSISEDCCSSTANVQKADELWGMHGKDEAKASCTQFNDTQVLSNTAHFCDFSLADNSVNCTYDIERDNPDCASEARATCSKNFGQIHASEWVQECGDGFSMTIRNSLTCVGTCTQKEVTEILWVGYFTRENDPLDPCKVVSIDGESAAKRRHQHAATGYNSYHHSSSNSRNKQTGTSGASTFIGIIAFLILLFFFGLASLVHNNRSNNYRIRHQPVQQFEMSPTSRPRPVVATQKATPDIIVTFSGELA